MVRFPSLTVKTPLTVWSWSSAEPSSEANVTSPVMVTSSAAAENAKSESETRTKRRRSRDFTWSMCVPFPARDAEPDGLRASFYGQLPLEWANRERERDCDE